MSHAGRLVETKRDDEPEHTFYEGWSTTPQLFYCIMTGYGREQKLWIYGSMYPFNECSKHNLPLEKSMTDPSCKAILATLQDDRQWLSSSCFVSTTSMLATEVTQQHRETLSHVGPPSFPFQKDDTVSSWMSSRPKEENRYPYPSWMTRMYPLFSSFGLSMEKYPHKRRTSLLADPSSASSTILCCPPGETGTSTSMRENADKRNSLIQEQGANNIHPVLDNNEKCCNSVAVPFPKEKAQKVELRPGLAFVTLSKTTREGHCPVTTLKRARGVDPSKASGLYHQGHYKFTAGGRSSLSNILQRNVQEAFDIAPSDYRLQRSLSSRNAKMSTLSGRREDSHPLAMHLWRSRSLSSSGSLSKATAISSSSIDFLLKDNNDGCKGALTTVATRNIVPPN